jgi:hypothetical protein
MRFSMSAVGPEWLFTSVGFPPPFALSLSKGQAELVEAFVPRAEGFNRLSPNGDGVGLRCLSPNGSLRTLNFRNGPKPEARLTRGGARSAVESKPASLAFSRRTSHALELLG